jgi:hypothetical protein
VWCLLPRDQADHVEPVKAFLGDRAEFIYDSSWKPRKMLEASPDVVLCANDFYYGVSRCLDAAREDGIPSLAMQDGILEWRCQYENPLFGSGGGAPQHQPVLADKIACIGHGSARHIASWGNSAKVEVTGMPRLDYLLPLEPLPRRHTGSRILVMTAKKPGFTEAQTRVTVRSLLDLKNYLASFPGIDVAWRLTKNLSTELGVENQLRSLGGEDLTHQLSQVDAVITTPSTAMLEAMLVGRPVACLDYHNTPRFVSTAWTISSPEHIGGVVAEILDPPAAKVAFQGECLQDSLLCAGPASTHVAELVFKMVAQAKASKRRRQRLRLPVRMVSSQQVPPEPCFPSLTEVYPRSKVFQERDAESLQVRLARAESENARLTQLQAQRRIGYWVQLVGRKAVLRLKTRYAGGPQ